MGALLYSISMCKAHEKTQGFGEGEDSEREWCAVMCQVMCVWAQRAEMVLRIGKECVQGRSPACTCVRSSHPLSLCFWSVSL